MRLIDADALKYTQAYEPCGNGQYKAVNIVYETDIDAAPTIEPKPSRDWNGWENGCGRTYDFELKHGKWITEYDSWGGLFKTVRAHKCSICGNYLDFDGVNAGRGDANYCPNCGAKMERSEDDA